MFVCETQYDVIVIGGGHAGCEAALAAAKLGAKTLLLTQNLDTIAQMSCNPSIGGIAKGQIVREIDALGGAMGRVTDFSALHYHMLNTGKGPAVHSPRVQCDKKVYQFTFKHFLELQPNLDIMQDEAVKITTSGNAVDGVLTLRDTLYKTKTVILTTGTFLGGTIHIGTVMTPGGRYNDMPSNLLSKNLSEELGLHLMRFKTGTPMRINARGLDYSKFRLQPSDNPLQPISHFTDEREQQNRKFLSCYITHTTLATDKILRENFQRSAMYGGNIHSQGPRYCPSVEDKIKKFPEVTSHPLFLEPEGAHTEEFYIQGFSTSMPEDVQRALIASVPGMENASITRMGYAVEYDCSNPMDLYPQLESKIVPGLFCAGQINGTTGYEEAGGQGLLAGINAALKVQGKEPFVLRRDEAYIGVLIDDLVTKGVNEPYRMFTSRAEYRILLRNDNADLRLMPHAFRLGLLDKKYEPAFEKYRALCDVLKTNLNAPVTDEPDLFPWSLEKARKHAEIHHKYEGYYERNKKDAEKLAEVDAIKIPEGFDPSSVRGLLFESAQKLREVKPQTLGQASRIPGVTPSDIQLLAVHIERFRRLKHVADSH
ncbi:tRNA uridine-5-carboxymethylaminomethyl(34) synthesis enzyme MnmG [Candidatus Avelusimicrobium caledoniensis]|uniref:tRNA uridine-5-carboxymethylaminomethyl(34) synthesis enzyme MnmG n=1 Tax=Candidatus Avelusimicrobium caledoniensis TaxID=3416220 RepID=UPI003D0DC118